jgi:hypothetical protein
VNLDTYHNLLDRVNYYLMVINMPEVLELSDELFTDIEMAYLGGEISEYEYNMLYNLL